MAMMPVRTKFRKMQKGQMAGFSKAANFLDFGEFGMQALERGWVTNHQIEACRVAITRYLNRRGQVWIRIFPDKSVTKKPAETRMGKGKGNPRPLGCCC
jgi:large subunit ribosomal protein L16